MNPSSPSRSSATLPCCLETPKIQSLRQLTTRAIRNGLIYGRIPRSSLSNLTQTHCLALVNAKALIGVTPKIVYSLERINPNLAELTHHVWEHIWENTYANNQLTCSAVEEQVAHLDEEVTYRSLYLKFMAMDQAKKAKLRGALSAKVAQIKPKHQVQQVKPGVMNVSVKRGWGSVQPNIGLMDSIRCKVRKKASNMTTALRVNTQKIMSTTSAMPPPQSKFHIRPSPDHLDMRRRDAPIHVRDPSDALADHVRRVLQARKLSMTTTTTTSTTTTGINQPPGNEFLRRLGIKCNNL